MITYPSSDYFNAGNRNEAAVAALINLLRARLRRVFETLGKLYMDGTTRPC